MEACLQAGRFTPSHCPAATGCRDPESVFQQLSAKPARLIYATTDRKEPDDLSNQIRRNAYKRHDRELPSRRCRRPLINEESMPLSSWGSEASSKEPTTQDPDLTRCPKIHQAGKASRGARQSKHCPSEGFEGRLNANGRFSNKNSNASREYCLNFL